jgi:hypothetical protein
MRELIANSAIAVAFTAVPVVVWLVGVRDAGPDQARVVMQWIAPWVGGAAIGLAVLAILGIRGKLVVPLNAEESEPHRARIGGFARITLPVAVAAAAIVPAVLGADVRIFAGMAACGFVAGLAPFQAYAAFVRFREARERQH